MVSGSRSRGPLPGPKPLSDPTEVRQVQFTAPATVRRANAVDAPHRSYFGPPRSSAGRTRRRRRLVRRAGLQRQRDALIWWRWRVLCGSNTARKTEACQYDATGEHCRSHNPSEPWTQTASHDRTPFVTTDIGLTALLPTGATVPRICALAPLALPCNGYELHSSIVCMSCVDDGSSESHIGQPNQRTAPQPDFGAPLRPHG